jgi:hypothetical protein
MLALVLASRRKQAKSPLKSNSKQIANAMFLVLSFGKMAAFSGLVWWLER